MTATPKKKQISALVMLMGSLLFMALVVIGGLILSLTPAGSKRLGAVLISPSKVSAVQAKIEWIVYKPDQDLFLRSCVTQQDYETFFEHLSHVKSQPDVSQEVIREFELTPTSTLSIGIEGQAWQLQFLQHNGSFRLLIPREMQWVYFYSPGVFEEAQRLLGS